MYCWNTTFIKDFKEFLSKIEPAELLVCISNKTYFDADKYKRKAKKEIMDLRKEGVINKVQARRLWETLIVDVYNEEFFLEETIWKAILDSTTLKQIYGTNIIYSPFAPGLDYPQDAKDFVENVFPKFQKVLRRELKHQDRLCKAQ